jgi:hypothetical protein
MAGSSTSRTVTRRDLLKAVPRPESGWRPAPSRTDTYERFDVGLTRETLDVSGLPQALAGLRVGLVTDLHRSDTSRTR